MKTKSLLLTIVLACIPSLASATPPNLCDDVYLDAAGVPLHDTAGTTIPRYCEFTGPRAPRWAAPVCCSFGDDDARCTDVSITGGCNDEQVHMWCDYGERFADGSVTCYQPVPSTCEAGFCVEAPGGTAEGNMPLCCVGGQGCFELLYGEYCGGLITFCDAPFTNEDGTVGCADDD